MTYEVEYLLHVREDHVSNQTKDFKLLVIGPLSKAQLERVV